MPSFLITSIGRTAISYRSDPVIYTDPDPSCQKACTWSPRGVGTCCCSCPVRRRRAREVYLQILFSTLVLYHSLALICTAWPNSYHKSGQGHIFFKLLWWWWGEKAAVEKNKNRGTEEKKNRGRKNSHIFENQGLLEKSQAQKPATKNP